MSEGPLPEDQTKPTYIMVPRKLIIAWITTTTILFGMNVANFQYTNYVDRRSNGLWCGIVTLFNDTYKKEPPSTDTGLALATEFAKIVAGFKCE